MQNWGALVELAFLQVGSCEEQGYTIELGGSKSLYNSQGSFELALYARSAGCISQYTRAHAALVHQQLRVLAWHAQSCACKCMLTIAARASGSARAVRRREAKRMGLTARQCR